MGAKLFSHPHAFTRRLRFLLRVSNTVRPRVPRPLLRLACEGRPRQRCPKPNQAIFVRLCPALICVLEKWQPGVPSQSQSELVAALDDRIATHPAETKQLANLAHVWRRHRVECSEFCRLSFFSFDLEFLRPASWGTLASFTCTSGRSQGPDSTPPPGLLVSGANSSLRAITSP